MKTHFLIPIKNIIHSEAEFKSVELDLTIIPNIGEAVILSEEDGNREVVYILHNYVDNIITILLSNRTH